MEKLIKLYAYVDGKNDTPFPNEEQQVVVSTFRADYKRMGGAPTITCTALHELCLDSLWDYNVYASFNGERFFIKQIPTSSFDNTDSRYKHEIELVSERIILDNVYFYDVVDSSSSQDKPVSNSLKFTFFGDIYEFASRLNESLNYSNVGYSVVVDSEITSESKQLSFQDQFFSNVLQEIYNTYNLPYYFNGKVIHIGYTDNAITHVFKYGVDESLLSVQKQNANFKIVNRVTGVGSQDNIPYYYPNDYESKDEVEANGGTWINPQTNLMPSIYRQSLGSERFYNALNNTYINSQSGEYYTFENPYIEGKPKEHIVNFDDIKPTIKGIKNASGERIDSFIEFAYDLNDSDEVDEEGNYLHPYFFAKLRKFDGEYGFNLFNHAIDESEMTISMTRGTCGSCEFVIGVDGDNQKNLVQVDSNGDLLRDENGNVRCGREGLQVETPQDQQNDTINNEVWIALRKDTNTFGVIMPNVASNYYPNAGDTFVILHIDLPKAYIIAAEDKLEEELIAYMALNNSEKFNFSISFSRIFFADNPDILSQLNENARLQVEYDNRTYVLYVSSYSYNMSNDKPLPEIKVELSDTLTIQQNALQNAISEVKQDLLASFGGSVDFLANGLRYFLRKDKADTAKEFITFKKGLKVGDFTEGTLGTGASTFMRDGSSYSEVDFLKVRKKATFTNITVQELKHVGGEIILSPAAMICSRVEELPNGYKCYFNKEDSDGRRVYNEFEVGDQARCQTFNLSPNGSEDLAGNHYYWRLVIEAEEDYIVLSKTDCDANSDIPQVGDNISQLGNRNNPERQAAIILSAYGSDAPSYKQYNGINSYSLVGKQVTKLSPFGNELTGIVNIEKGSSGWNNLEGLPDSIQNAVDLANKAQETIDNTSVGAVNLLRNSGFTGDYESEDMLAPEHLEDGSELFSERLENWEGDAVAYTDTNAVSGNSVQLGTLSQSVKELVSGEDYVLSFKARGSVINVRCGSYEVSQNLTSGYKRYELKFNFSGSKTFSIEGSARVCDLQLERGTIATDWNPSPYDNDKTLAEFMSLKYIQDAIVNGSTNVIGGLILTSMMKLGNYKDGVMKQVNAGISGIYNDSNDVAFWAGGTFEEAIKTIVKFKSNPRYRPTDEEWLNLANFAVSHGGDIFLRGYVYALGGFFRGAVEIANGKVMLNDDGSGHLADGNIRWTKEGLMYKKALEFIEWKSILDFYETHVVNYDDGLYFNMSVNYSDTLFYTLPRPDHEEFSIVISLPYLSRSNASAILYADEGFRVYNGDNYVDTSYLTIDFSGINAGKEFVLDYYDEQWHLRGETCSIQNVEIGGIEYEIAYAGASDYVSVGEDSEASSRVVISKDKVVANAFETPSKSYKVDSRGNITLNEYDAAGNSTFKNNIITPIDIILMDWVSGDTTTITCKSINTTAITSTRTTSSYLVANGFADDAISTSGGASIAKNVSCANLNSKNNVNGVNGIFTTSVQAASFKSGESTGLSKEITIKDTEGTHTLTFTSGLLTAHSFTANETEVTE